MKPLMSVSVAISAAIIGFAASSARAQERVNAHAAHKGTFNYFRTEPNRHSHIIEKMRQGTPFVVTGKSGDYDSIVLADGRSGWTYVGNVAIDGENPTAVRAAEGGEVVAPVVPAVPGMIRQEPVVAPVAPVAAMRGPEVVKVVREPAAPTHRIVRVTHARARVIHPSRAPRVTHTRAPRVVPVVRHVISAPIQ